MPMPERQQWGEWSPPGQAEADPSPDPATEDLPWTFQDWLILLVGICLFCNARATFELLHTLFGNLFPVPTFERKEGRVVFTPLRENVFGQWIHEPGVMIQVPRRTDTQVYYRPPREGERAGRFDIL